MSGIKDIVGGDFHEVDLDYGTTPGTDSEKQPPKAIFADTLPASHDNTIAPGGLGPNVATLNIESTDDPGKGLPMINAGSTAGAPFESPVTTEPFDSSFKTAAGGIHGGEAAQSGVPGDSVVTLGSKQ